MAHTPYDELKNQVAKALKQVCVSEEYYHWKDPETHYVVLGIGFAEWSEELVVTYQHLPDGIIWTRKLAGEDGWLTPAENNAGEKTDRFIKVK